MISAIIKIISFFVFNGLVANYKYKLQVKVTVYKSMLQVIPATLSNIY